MRRYASLGLLGLLMVHGVACTDSGTMGSEPAKREVTVTDGPKAAACYGEWAEVTQGCPQTFDGTNAQLPASCSDQTWWVSSQTCGDLVRLQIVNGLWGVSCSYDPTTHELVGAQRGSDTNSYCNDTSATQSNGRVAACDSATGTVTYHCATGVTD